MIQYLWTSLLLLDITHEESAAHTKTTRTFLTFCKNPQFTMPAVRQCFMCPMWLNTTGPPSTHVYQRSPASNVINTIICPGRKSPRMKFYCVKERYCFSSLFPCILLPKFLLLQLWYLTPGVLPVMWRGGIFISMFMGWDLINAITVQMGSCHS
jgi:hypothetical protein